MSGFCHRSNSRCTIASIRCIRCNGNFAQCNEKAANATGTRSRQRLSGTPAVDARCHAQTAESRSPCRPCHDTFQARESWGMTRDFGSHRARVLKHQPPLVDANLSGQGAMPRATRVGVQTDSDSDAVYRSDSHTGTATSRWASTRYGQMGTVYVSYRSSQASSMSFAIFFALGSHSSSQ